MGIEMKKFIFNMHTIKRIRNIMKLPITQNGRNFFQGFLSAFRLHPNRVFLNWMEDYAKRSDIENLQSDLEKVGSDMRNVMSKQMGQRSAR